MRRRGGGSWAVEGGSSAASTQFTGFTGVLVQILTQARLTLKGGRTLQDPDLRASWQVFVC